MPGIKTYRIRNDHFPSIRRLRGVLTLTLMLILIYSCKPVAEKQEDLVAYIDPTIGNVSRFLVPTYPTFHLPNQMLRMVPQKTDYISDEVEGFPLQVAGHRNRGLFQMKVWTGPRSGNGRKGKMYIDHDLEINHPWHYSTYLIEQDIRVSFTPGKKSAIFQIDFPEGRQKHLLIEGSDALKDRSENGGEFLLEDQIRFLSPLSDNGRGRMEQESF